MDTSKDRLRKYYDSHSKFIKLESGKSISVTYLYAKEEPNHFEKGDTTIMEYHLEVNGMEKILRSASLDLIKQMAAIDEGSMISIKRIGEGMQTKYFVTKIEEL